MSGLVLWLADSVGRLCGVLRLQKWLFPANTELSHLRKTDIRVLRLKIEIQKDDH